MNHGYIHLDTTSVLVSTPKGLIRAYCPIKAICITNDLEGFVVGDTAIVNAIYFSKKSPLLYEISGIKLPYQHFKLVF